MSEAVRYIWRESVWAPAHAADARWFITLQRDLQDALRLGQIKSVGRGQDYGKALEEIEPEHWATHRPEIFDILAFNNTANVSRDTTGRGYEDVRLDLGDIKRLWPPMGWLKRRRHQPLVLR